MQKNYSKRTQVKCLFIFVMIVLPLVVAGIAFCKPNVVFFTVNFLVGALGWTYLEYHIHRFWTHSKSSNSSKVAFQRHKHHHSHPTEIKVSAHQRAVLLAASMFLFTAAVLWNSYFTIFAGFAIAFAYSFFSHWILHQAWSKKVFPHLHQFHIHHHCKYPDRCFGFSTIFWDLVFRTTPPKNAVITDRIIQFYYGRHDH